MKRTVLFAVLFFVAFSLNVSATQQIPDILIYQGKEYPVHAGFLEVYFKKFPERNPKDDEIVCSALGRGYKAIYEVVNGKIYLKDIFTNVCSEVPTSQIKRVVPGGGRLWVDWASQLVWSGYGENTEDSYGLAFLDAYTKYSFFEVVKGRVLDVRHFDNKSYRKFKEKQFEAFRKTAEYEKAISEILARNPRMSRKDADSNIQLTIFWYTTKFLVPKG